MAEKSFVSSLAPLTRNGYLIVVSALELKHASLMRSVRSESDSAIRDLRQKQADEVMSLISGFRQSAS